MFGHFTLNFCPYFVGEMAAVSYKEGYNNAFPNRYAQQTDQTTGEEITKLCDEWAPEYDKVHYRGSKRT